MLDFIVNPSAGGKDGTKVKKALPKLEKILVERHIPYVIHMTKTPHHATTLTQSLIKHGATDIIVVGGDGTLHEVINGFSDFERVNMGIIPCGTGNDFADVIKLSLDPEEALEQILNGEPKYTDFMQMPTVRGLNIIGMGVDVDVLKRYESLKRKTKAAYTRCLIKSLFKPRMAEFDAEIEGETKHYKSFIACIANGNRYGGGIPICPIATPTDNKLNFLTLDEVRGLTLVKSFLKLKKGLVLTLPVAHERKITKVKITTEGDYTVNVDGELYDNIPFEVEIVSNKLKIYRP